MKQVHPSLEGAVRELLRLGLSYKEASRSAHTELQTVLDLAYTEGLREGGGCYQEQLLAYATNLQPDLFPDHLSRAVSRTLVRALNEHLDIEHATDLVQSGIVGHTLASFPIEHVIKADAAGKAVTTMNTCLRLIATDMRRPPSSAEDLALMCISHFEWNVRLALRPKRRRAHIHLVR